MDIQFLSTEILWLLFPLAVLFVLFRTGLAQREFRQWWNSRPKWEDFDE